MTRNYKLKEQHLNKNKHGSNSSILIAAAERAIKSTYKYQKNSKWYKKYGGKK